MQSLEDIRRSWRPGRVRVLFVGESPPAGGTFFYQGDSNLFRYTREAFSRALEQDWGQDPTAFLAFFAGCGCYLEDLCPIPVNHLPARERKRVCRESNGDLARRLEGMSPEMVIVVKRDLKRPVRKALEDAGLGEAVVHALPFPTYGHQRRFTDALADIIGTWYQPGVKLSKLRVS